MLGEKGAYMIREHWAMQYATCLAFNYYFLGENESNKCFYTQLP
jgi:hypothetical protein